jgi:prevent-host-death family protein
MLENATKVKNNFGKYLEIALREDVYILKNGKPVAKLTNIKQDRIQMAKSLFGVIPEEASLEDARKKRRKAL